MDLHAIAAPIVAAVNPYQEALIMVSNGYTTNPDFSRTPLYKPTRIPVQVQALTYKDLQQLSGINMNGEARGVYFFGDFNGVVRAAQQGGDLVTLSEPPNAGNWLIVHVLENWPGWTKAACVLQTGAKALPKT